MRVWAAKIYLSLIIVLLLSNNLFSKTVIYGRLESVVDGDTVKIMLEDSSIHTVRMLGIDTPETKYYGKGQGFYGMLAYEYLRNRIPPFASVRIKVEDEVFDRFGRILGRVFYKGRDINKELLKMGLACLYVINPTNRRLLRTYVKTASKAFEEGKGMFDPELGIQELPYEFRMKVSEREPNKYVGDFDTKFFYAPDKYKDIPVPKRVFFLTQKDAVESGFNKAPLN